MGSPAVDGGAVRERHLLFALFQGSAVSHRTSLHQLGHAAQHGHRLGAGQGALWGKGTVAHAVDKAHLIGDQNVLLLGGNIGKGVGRLLVQLGLLARERLVIADGHGGELLPGDGLGHVGPEQDVRIELLVHGGLQECFCPGRALAPGRQLVKGILNGAGDLQHQAIGLHHHLGALHHGVGIAMVPAVLLFPLGVVLDEEIAVLQFAGVFIIGVIHAHVQPVILAVQQHHIPLVLHPGAVIIDELAVDQAAVITQMAQQHGEQAGKMIALSHPVQHHLIGGPGHIIVGITG